ncbi:MAG TPA: phospholipase D-like domain-containing protein, partial [Gemmatimonadaceae bacterium]|nr:phospholipase D-like domain-containing protein [Gemmatimonadaceae bacterium]
MTSLGVFPRLSIHHVGRLLNWIMIAVVIVIAIIGFLYITRGTAVRRVRAVGTDGSPVAPDEETFPLTVALLTGAVLMPGNEVELVLDGSVFPRLYEDLRGAKRSITIQMYYSLLGKVTEKIAEILSERAKAGVQIFVMYDAFGSSALGGDFARKLRDAGVNIIPFRPLRFRNLWIVQNRAHIRGIIIDGEVGWTGGFGFDDKWLGEGRVGTGWRDTAVRIRGPAVM